MAKRWVYKTDLRKIRPAIDREMVAPGKFSKEGDMIIESRWGDYDFLISKDTFERDFVEVEVPDDKGDNNGE